jgi:hypothetical protein
MLFAMGLDMNEVSGLSVIDGDFDLRTVAVISADRSVAL